MISFFRCGNLTLESFSYYNEIHIEIGDTWQESLSFTEYLGRSKVIELRDWLTEQLEVNEQIQSRT